jgi:hypothetical protein
MFSEAATLSFYADFPPHVHVAAATFAIFINLETYMLLFSIF